MNFDDRLKGGHPNSLGNTIEVVDEVLSHNELFEVLFQCYFSEDAIVRLRVSNAMKRICKVKKSILIPFINRFLDEISQIDQASTQWTLAQLFLLLDKDLTDNQKGKAKTILKHNLASHSDWIVLNETMKTLSIWAKSDSELRTWMVPHLERLSNDERKSVSKKASKLLSSFI